MGFLSKLFKNRVKEKEKEDPADMMGIGMVDGDYVGGD